MVTLSTLKLLTRLRPGLLGGCHGYCSVVEVDNEINIEQTPTSMNYQ